MCAQVVRTALRTQWQTPRPLPAHFAGTPLQAAFHAVTRSFAIPATSALGWCLYPLTTLPSGDFRNASWKMDMPSKGRNPSRIGTATDAGTRTTGLLPPSPPRPMGASAEAAQAASCTVSIRAASDLGRLAAAAAGSFSEAPSFLFVPFFVRARMDSSASARARSSSGARSGPNCDSRASQSCFSRPLSTRLSEATNSSTNNLTFASAGSTTSGCATMNASKAAASKPTNHLSLRGSQAGCFSPGFPGAPLFSFSQSALSFPL
mmetsp:Transcript_85300/g.206754  ORF Transcript_85300/g.206754 Transcript_85300/m.206754 type:complete len:263 (+) Transcript_85300:3-791(+)